MFLQSILVYLTLMGAMILFAVSASRNHLIIESPEDRTIKYKSFWSFSTIMPLLLFAIVFGMRYDVGVDHLNYLYGYVNRIYVGKNEPLFFLFSDIGWLFNFHFAVYFALIAFAQVFFFFFAFKDERYLFPLLVFFIFTNGDFFFWMNGIRQALAMTIWISSLRYIEERKLIKYVFWGIVSVLIHKSAIVLLVFYPILRNGKDYFKSIPLQLVLLSSAFVVKEVFYDVIVNFESVINTYISLLGEDMYEKSYNIDRLVGSVKESEGTGLAYLFKILINVVVIIYSTKLKSYYNSKRFNMIYFIFFLGLITMYIFPIGVISFSRPFRYFYIFQSIIYAYFAYYLFKNKTKGFNMFVLVALIVGFLGIFVLSQYTATESSSSLFQFYFQQENILEYPIRN